MDGFSHDGQVKGVLAEALFFSCTPVEFFSLQFHILGATYSTLVLMLAWKSHILGESTPQRARKTRAVQWDAES